MTPRLVRTLVAIALFPVGVGVLVGAPTFVGAADAGSASLSLAAQRQEEGLRARTSIYMKDFGELARYRAANAALKPPASGESRVVFFGDSCPSPPPR